MRKQDLVVGESYAIGGSSHWDRWRHQRGVLVELDGERIGERYGKPAVAKGIVIRLDEGASLPAAVPYNTLRFGDEIVLQSARPIVCRWALWAKAKAEHDAAVNARKTQLDSDNAAAQEARNLLLAAGVRHVEVQMGRGLVCLKGPDALRVAQALTGAGVLVP